MYGAVDRDDDSGAAAEVLSRRRGSREERARNRVSDIFGCFGTDSGVMSGKTSVQSFELAGGRRSKVDLDQNLVVSAQIAERPALLFARPTGLVCPEETRIKEMQNEERNQNRDLVCISGTVIQTVEVRSNE